MDVMVHLLPLDSLKRVVCLYGLGDLHLGAPACDVEKFKEVVEEIRTTPNAYWIGMGDYIDGITHTDRKRFDPGEFKGSELRVEELVDLPYRQAEQFIELVLPIKKQCVGFFEGNHEWVGTKWSARDIGHYMSSSLGQPWLGPSGFVKLRFFSPDALKSNLKVVKKRGELYSVTVFCHHGYGGGRLAGADALELQRQVLGVEADIFFFGHRHSGVQVPAYRLRLDSRFRIRRSPVVGLMTGSFLRTVVPGGVTYAEKRGYRYAVVGAPHVEIRGYLRNQSGSMVLLSLKSVGIQMDSDAI